MRLNIVFLGIAFLLSVSTGLTQNISGTMKRGPKYELKGNTLIISGNGEMDNYLVTTAPWQNSRKNIEKVIIGEGITHIGNYSFLKCDILKKVTIPETVISIGEQAFRDCMTLDSITIPKNVRTIGEYALFGCNNLRLIVIHRPEPPKISKMINMKTQETIVIMVPGNSIFKYKNDDEWGKFPISPLPSLKDDTGTSRAPVSQGTGKYFIIVGFGRDRSEAEKKGKNLHDKYGYLYSIVKVNDTLYRVSVDSFDDEKKAKQELENWKKKPGIPEDSWYYHHK